MLSQVSPVPLGLEMNLRWRGRGWACGRSGNRVPATEDGGDRNGGVGERVDDFAPWRWRIWV